MEIGIPREIKILEGRVALTPEAIGKLVKMGHRVFVEEKAGLLSGYSNEKYLDAGAILLKTAKDVYDSAILIVKVKKPQAEELKYLRKEHILFSFLHLAAVPALTSELLKIGLTAVAFETVRIDKHLPLLAPMSDIAGRISIQVGTHLLHQPEGGRGILLGGVSGVSEMATEKGNVVILGGGTAGSGAAQMASAMRANVLVFDPDSNKQAQLESMGPNVTAQFPTEQAIAQAVKDADLLVGAVLIPGARAPHLVSAEQVKLMKAG